MSTSQMTQKTGFARLQPIAVLTFLELVTLIPWVVFFVLFAATGSGIARSGVRVSDIGMLSYPILVVLGCLLAWVAHQRSPRPYWIMFLLLPAISVAMLFTDVLPRPESIITTTSAEFE